MLQIRFLELLSYYDIVRTAWEHAESIRNVLISIKNTITKLDSQWTFLY